MPREEQWSCSGCPEKAAIAPIGPSMYTPPKDWAQIHVNAENTSVTYDLCVECWTIFRDRMFVTQPKAPHIHFGLEQLQRERARLLAEQAELLKERHAASSIDSTKNCEDLLAVAMAQIEAEEAQG